MTRAHFADTWYYVALCNPLDSAHFAAKRIERRISADLIVTHDAIFTELLAFFSDDGRWLRDRAAQSARDVLRRGGALAADRELFVRALDLYERRPDKQYSLTDCMSMVVMRDLGIRHVLTNDHHFRQEGFEVVSE